MIGKSSKSPRIATLLLNSSYKKLSGYVKSSEASNKVPYVLGVEPAAVVPSNTSVNVLMIVLIDVATPAHNGAAPAAYTDTEFASILLNV